MTMKSSFSTCSTSPVLSRLQHAPITILNIYEPENADGLGGNSWVIPTKMYLVVLREKTRLIAYISALKDLGIISFSVQ